MKKFASLLLTVALLATMLSVFAVPAFAEGETESINKPEGAEWLVDEGDNHVWYKLTENDTVLPDGKTGRTMTVGGKGKMPHYVATVPQLDERPWKGYIETITTVVIESGVTNIGNHAFNGCTNLTSVTIPSSVTNIGAYAFQNCKSLQSVTIPSSVMNIGTNAFYGCASLQSVTIPYGVTSIGQYTFYNCANLQSVTIPSSVMNIGWYAFYGCASLQSVTIPYGVTSIGQCAFYICTNLQSVTIPSSVTNIGVNAFACCRNLASVTVKTSTPPTLGQMVFNNTRPNLAIYVPCGAGTAYQEATNWSDKSGQIKEAYIVDDQPVGKGTVMFDKDCFPKETYTEPNKTVTVTVMPADGYRLKADSLLVKYNDNGEEKTATLTQNETDTTKYTFTMPKANVTVTAEFEKITDNTETGSTLSDGNVWIIAAVAVVAVAGAAALIIVKKKKKPALASGENTDEE